MQIRIASKRFRNNHNKMIASDKHPGLDEAVALLQRLISTPSPSREETATADIWEEWLQSHGVENVERLHNNVFVLSEDFDPTRRCIIHPKSLSTVDRGRPALWLRK